MRRIAEESLAKAGLVSNYASYLPSPGEWLPPLRDFPRSWSPPNTRQCHAPV